MKRSLVLAAALSAVIVGSVGAEPSRVSAQDVLNHVDLSHGWNVGSLTAQSTDFWLYPQTGAAPTETTRPAAASLRRTALVSIFTEDQNITVHFYGSSANADSGGVRVVAGAAATFGLCSDSIRVDVGSATDIDYVWTLSPLEQ